jgi:FAD-linked oxidoreductase
MVGARADWTNWAGTAACRPAAVDAPASEEEIVAAVRAAVAAGQRVKAVGSGHSFTDIACTDGRLLRLDGYDRVLEVDVERGTATVQSGITLENLSRVLAGFDLALENLGDVGYQTIAGAISTATHGTGERWRNLSSQVCGLRLVTAAGEVLECSPERDPETFKAAQVSLGALGVISTVTLRCVPAFYLRSVQERQRLDELLERFDERCAEYDHFEFFWWPHTPWAQAIANRRSPEPLPGKPRRGPGSYLTDVVLDNHAFGLLQGLARLNRSWIPRLTALSARAMGRREIADRSHRVFLNRRLVRFAEMEYALPREQLVPALKEVRRMIDRTGLLVSFPVEVRAVAADDIPLSPAYGRPTGYIAVHVFHRFEYERYFREVEAIMTAHQGRPHWGKLHFQEAAGLRPRYPLWDRFLAVRDRLDPQGVFANPYLDRVLGRPGNPEPPAGQGRSGRGSKQGDG